MDFVGEKIYKCGNILSKIYKCGEVVWSANTEPDYSKMPLTFEAEDPESFLRISFPRAISFEYSTDEGKNWETATTNSIQRPLWIDEDHKTFMIKANETSYNGTSLRRTTGPFKVYGNIMSLLNSTEYAEMQSFTSNAVFKDLFSNCTGLTSAENLVLPATALTQNCYFGMFWGCTSLTEAPALPATRLAQSCYHAMFSYCTSLTKAPALPATELADWCYVSMFTECTALTDAPELPATTLAQFCYSDMFNVCTSLTKAPALPATELAANCYMEMFSGCTSLTDAPELPATTLAQNCYNFMFQACSSLVTPPDLPATTLAQDCYAGMFRDCVSLTKSPDLLVNKLERGCYSHMFNGCTSLTYVKCLGEDILYNNTYYYTAGWLNNTPLTGTFVKKAGVYWPRATSGIPAGWTVIEE